MINIYLSYHFYSQIMFVQSILFHNMKESFLTNLHLPNSLHLLLSFLVSLQQFLLS